MKPLRPAWITLAAVVCLLALTIWAFVVFGWLIALAPLAIMLAFVYDLTHHAKSRQLKILSRVIVLLMLAFVIVVGLYLTLSHSSQFTF